MFGKSKPDYSSGPEVLERPVKARGGVSVGSILTGALVAIGAFFLLSSIVGAVLSQSNVSAEELANGEAVDAGVAGGIALLVAWFLSFLWGGYAAGRMGRGAGFVNGLLVPLGAIALAAIAGLILWAFDASEGFSLTSPTEQLQVEGQYTSVDYGIALGAITLGIMFVGGIVGGLLGQRWHTKLERRSEAAGQEALVARRKEETRQVDLTEREERAEREHAEAFARTEEAGRAERTTTHPAGTGGYSSPQQAPPATPYNPGTSSGGEGNPTTRM